MRLEDLGAAPGFRKPFEYNTSGGTQPLALDPWIEHLLTEYKILQDKLDKIGSFRFTIKGWSVTVTVASLAAATATNSSAFAAVLPLLIVLVFFLLEWRQHSLSAIYSDRLLDIETALARHRSGTLPDLSSIRFIPGIANSVTRVALRKRNLVPWKKVKSDSDYLIYVIQVVVILAVAGIQFFRAPSPATKPEANYVFMSPAAENGSTPSAKPGDSGVPGQEPGLKSTKQAPEKAAPKQKQDAGKGTRR
jgi:hypothetical protein